MHKRLQRKFTMRKKIFVIVASLLLFFVLVKVILSVKDFIPVATNVVLHPAQTLRESNGKINILILGIGGGTHDGPDLTDTIMYASLNPKANTVTLISIPRDLWIPDLKGRINTAYAMGEDNGQHKGLLMAKSVVESITGQPVDYVFRIDFGGFVKAVDNVGGIDVTVQHTLDDYAYPIPGKEDETCGHTDKEIQDFTASQSGDLAVQQEFSCRFKHLHFDPGLQHMDGETALEFVRSRHAIGSEGTDFARSARQQLVIEAFRNKVLSVSTLLHPGTIFNFYNILKDSIDTDIQQNEFTLFVQLFQKMQHAKINPAVIDFGDAAAGRPGLLEEAPITASYGFADVLIPRIGNGNFTEIQKYVACELSTGDCPISKEPETATASKKK